MSGERSPVGRARPCAVAGAPPGAEDAPGHVAAEPAAARPATSTGPPDPRGRGTGARRSRRPSSGDAWLAAGRLHLARHHASLAAGESDPRHARAAVRALRRAARRGDPSGRAHALLAEAAVACCRGAGFVLRAQMIVTAQRAARAALARRPDAGEAHAALGVLALHAPGHSSTRAAAARVHLEAAVRAEPGRADWRAWLARACLDAGDLERARREIAAVRGGLAPAAAEALLAAVVGTDRVPGDAARGGSAARPHAAPGVDSSRPAAVSVCGVRRGYGSRLVLRGVDLEVRAGEVVALVGANGAGKTTLLGAIAGRVAIEAGRITVLGRAVRPGRMPSGLGYAPQGAGLYPLLTVQEHLACFARLHGLRGRAAAERVDEALDWSGLGDRADDLARSLSAGMRRRLAVALAAVHAPPVLLLDEPMTAVDAAHRERIGEMLRARAAAGAAIVCAAPSAEDLHGSADRLVELAGGFALARCAAEAP